MVFAPETAVTNAHNANLVSRESVVGQSRNYDLLFFRVPSAPQSSVPTSQPRKGEAVIAYGQGRDGDVRIARGVVTDPALDIPAECAGCGTQRVFVFVGDGGKGFSGGPVIDASTGALLGVVFAFRDTPGGRQIFAYDMAHVVDQFGRVKKP